MLAACKVRWHGGGGVRWGAGMGWRGCGMGRSVLCMEERSTDGGYSGVGVAHGMLTIGNRQSQDAR
jgi:hypothetical protein